MKSFYVIRVGNDERPAGPEDIEQVKKEFEKFKKENNLEVNAFITHHTFDIQQIFLNN